MPRVLLTVDERMLLQTSVRRMLDDDWGTPCDKSRLTSAAAGERTLRSLAELGLTDLAPAESGGGLVELLIAMEELGRSGCPLALHAPYLMRCAWQGSEPPAWLDDVLTGSMRLALALPSDRDTLQLKGKLLSGTAAFTEGYLGATHLLILGSATERPLILVDLAMPNARARAVEVFGQAAQGGLHELHFDGAPCLCTWPMSSSLTAQLTSTLRACLSARAIGAARRNLALVIEYSKDRRQFGKAIASFQAIQHKLADVHIAIEGLVHALAFAAELKDGGVAEWDFYADCAFAHAADVLPSSALQLQHAFGAIGYAEEHEAPRHFRRMHLDMLGAGGRQAARTAIARHVMRFGALPDRPLGADAAAFRLEVRAWLAEHWADEQRSRQRQQAYAVRDRDPAFGRKVGAQGWASLTWPTEFGGLARPIRHQMVLVEEMERAGAPRFGAPIHAAAFMAFGTEEQKAEHLARIRHGDGIYGIGYSEPGSGSDLASVRMSAVRTGDQWVLNGQKIWTTTYWGPYMWVLARTDATASPPHAGLTLFVFPMNTPGITVVPNETMYGGTFANIFYDDLRLPDSAVVGEVNGAWKVLGLALSVERAVIGGGILSRVVQSFDDLLKVVTSNPESDAASRDLIGSFAARLVVGQALAERSVQAVESGGSGTVEAAICKVFCSELMEDFYEEAIRWGGLDWVLSEGEAGAPCEGRYEQRLRHSLMHVISGGTNEIQRNLIAQKGLGLPRA